MAAIDLSPYVDLRVYDKDSQDVIDAALVNLTTILPEWIPREGNMEMILLEAMGLEVSEAIAAINRLPSATVEVLFKLFGIERDLGIQPTTTLTFNLSDTLGHDIPAGSRASLSLGSGIDPVVFTTTQALAVPAGQSSGTVAATGDRFTADANGTAGGTLLESLDAITYLNSVVLGSAVVGGKDEETDQEWYDRAINRFGRLSETLAVPAQFVAAAKEHVEVIRAHAVDNYDPAVGPNPGDNLGHVTVAVYGDHANLSTTFKNDLDAELELAAQANLSVHVIDPTVTTVNVTVSVVKNTQYTDATAIARVQDALEAFLDSSSWDFSSTVYKNSLIAVVGGDEAVAYVSSMTVPAGDTALTGVAPLTTPGTLTVTVVNSGGGSL